MSIPRFHLAFPVHDIDEARKFYSKTLGCTLGRESESLIDFNLYGLQLVAHLSPEDCRVTNTNPVDNDAIPSRHFGVILEWRDWESLQEKIKKLDYPLKSWTNKWFFRVVHFPSSSSFSSAIFIRFICLSN